MAVDEGPDLGERREQDVALAPVGHDIAFDVSRQHAFRARPSAGGLGQAIMDQLEQTPAKKRQFEQTSRSNLLCDPIKACGQVSADKAGGSDIRRSKRPMSRGPEFRWPSRGGLIPFREYDPTPVPLQFMQARG